MSNDFKYLPGGIIMALTAFLYGKISSNKKETKSNKQLEFLKGVYNGTIKID